MELSALIEAAYLEDIPSGDVTSSSLDLSPLIAHSQLIAKQDLVLSGLEIFASCFRYRDPEASIKWYFADGDVVLKDQTVALIKADRLKTLEAERVAMNFLGHLSGISTLTKHYVKEIVGDHCKILDTRKTTPLLRKWEKKAVRDGGGHNHRMNLSDQIMIKENHIAMVGGIQKAVTSAFATGQEFVEIECKNLEEVKLAVELGVSRIMLDNMDNRSMAAALELIPSDIETEASGNMSLERISQVSELGVDFISVGALTHSAPVADFSLLTKWD